jgi:hypothetical protein
VTMEIDAFHDGEGIALEVEAGRAWNGNAVYRDLIRISPPARRPVFGDALATGIPTALSEDVDSGLRLLARPT